MVHMNKFTSLIKCSISFFPLVVLIFTAGDLFPYNSDNHRIITERAVKYLNEKFPGFVTEDEARQLLKGNISEERFGLKWLNRPFRQHFYNPEKDENLRRKWKSINKHFNSISTKLQDKKSSRRFFYSLGEVIHYIQDMTNPAHVVPVYHGGCCMKDKFDEQNLSNVPPPMTSISVNRDFYKPFDKSILGPVASETLNRLKIEFDVRRTRKVNDHEVSDVIVADWSYFWKADDDGWFGEYGSLGHPNGKPGGFSDNFSETRIERGTVVYEIEESVYVDFTEDQISLAVLKTAEFIYFAKTKWKSV